MIADDTDIAREGLTRILAAETDMEIVGEGTTIHGTVSKVHELRPDVLILDLMWFKDEAAGTSAIKRLAQEVPETKVIAITVYPHLIEQAKNAGAVAALNKEEVSKRQLVEEIRAVHALPPPPPAVMPSATPLVEELTKRERQVLALMAEGKMDREIAVELTIAESTAKNHVSHILGKLDVPNRARAVAVGYELGIIGANKE
jgi:DNA-binding NarL/FixJ family response regulator